MGKRGPKRQPTPIKILKGTYRRDRHGDIDAEPKAKRGMMRVPTWAALSATGKKVWADTLERIPDGIAGKTDVHMLVQYCKAWEQFLIAEKELDGTSRYYTTESGAIRQHPAVKELEASREAIRRIASLFGLSPSDRAGMKVETTQSSGVSTRRRA